MKADMNIRLTQETAEKSELISELRRHQDTLDTMSSKHKALVDDVLAREDEVVQLEVSFIMQYTIYNAMYNKHHHIHYILYT